MIQDRRRAVRFGLALIGLMAAIIIGDELRIFGEPPAPIQNEEFTDVGNGCPRHHPHLRLVADYTSAKFCTTEDCMAKMKCPVDGRCILTEKDRNTEPRLRIVCLSDREIFKAQHQK
jgi:hypothetical protein